MGRLRLCAATGATPRDRKTKLAPSVDRMLKGGAGHKDAVSTRPLTRKQRLLHALLFVVLPYLLARAEPVMAQAQWGARGSGGWRKSAWLVGLRSQAAYQILSAVNFLVFLRAGRLNIKRACSRSLDEIASLDDEIESSS